MLLQNKGDIFVRFLFVRDCFRLLSDGSDPYHSLTLVSATFSV